MIGRLVGEIIERELQQLLLDVRGVSYEVAIPLTTYYQLAEVEGSVTLYTHLVVRDDAHLLYGFSSREGRNLFRTLIKVNGVGPKTGLAILSGLDNGALAGAIVAKDVKLLAGIPGVSKKIAERMIIDLEGKLEEFVVPQVTLGTMPTDVSGDVESALIGLGYKPQEAARAIAQIESPAEEVETLIKQALRQLMQG